MLRIIKKLTNQKKKADKFLYQPSSTAFSIIITSVLPTLQLFESKTKTISIISF
jgi:hypothetical protein